MLFHGEPGEIEFVADSLVNDPETEWFVQEYGGGVMVVEPKVFGRAFLSDTESTEDLTFIARSAGASSGG